MGDAKTTRVRLLASRSIAGVCQAYGEIVDEPADQAARMIERGEAAAVDPQTALTHVPPHGGGTPEEGTT